MLFKVVLFKVVLFKVVVVIAIHLKLLNKIQTIIWVEVMVQLKIILIATNRVEEVRKNLVVHPTQPIDLIIRLVVVMVMAKKELLLLMSLKGVMLL